jgi:metallo-beta-lactamase family protein
VRSHLEVAVGVHATFIDAGHILGSASIFLEFEEQSHGTSVLFSGDLGNAGRLLLRGPAQPSHAENVVMETTYGDRLHKQLGPSIDEFYEAITETFKRGGNVIIPTFALERAQELLYFLSAGVTQGRLAKSTQVYLDSPMAISTTEIFRRHPECFEPATAKLFQGRSHFVPGSGREPLQQILKTQLTSRDGGSGQAGGPAYNGYRLNGTTLPRERCLPSLSAACTLMASSSPTNGFLIIRASLISSSAALST